MEMRVTKEELHTVVTELLKQLHSAKSDTATVVALHGDLGAGKTTLTQALGQALGVKENLISPTFVIMKKYQVADPVFKLLFHIDAYRLEKSEELQKLGWAEICADPTNLVIVEWPELVPDCIPANACRIELTHIDQETRVIKFG